jgi:hypothetical protein
MEIVSQLSVFLENRPGTLAQMCRELADAGLSIYALTVSDTVDHAVVRILVSDPLKAAHLLGEHGVLVLERDVMVVEAENRPGVLAEIAAQLADANVNIEYAYCASPPGANQGIIVIRPSDMEGAAAALGG